MAVIDKANAFYLRPVELNGSPYTESTAQQYDSEKVATAQSASNILDFGSINPESGFTKHPARHNNINSYLIVNTTASSGSVKLQEADSISGTWSDIANSTVTVAAAGKTYIKFPAHAKRFVRAALTTLTASNTDVYIGTAGDIED